MSGTLAHGSVAKMGDHELIAADDYLAARASIKEAEAVRDRAKAQLLTALGELMVGLLPDGRTVRRTRTEIAAATIERRAYVSETLAID